MTSSPHQGVDSLTNQPKLGHSWDLQNLCISIKCVTPQDSTWRFTNTNLNTVHLSHSTSVLSVCKHRVVRWSFPIISRNVTGKTEQTGYWRFCFLFFCACSAICVLIITQKRPGYLQRRGHLQNWIAWNISKQVRFNILPARTSVYL